MSTLEAVKAAAAALDPDEQVEFFKWWTQSDTFRARQLAALKREIGVGIEQLERECYRAYDDADVMQLAEEVRRSRVALGRRQAAVRAD